MSAAVKRWISPEEYLAIERQAEFRSEYYRGETFPRFPASFEHCAIKDNLAGETGMQLKGTGCRVRTSALRIKVSATGLYAYPDVAIICEKPRFEDAYRDTLLNPQVVIEVLSNSTERYDRGEKFEHYQQVPSIKEYILVAQDRPFTLRFVRQPDGTWTPTEFEGLEPKTA